MNEQVKDISGEPQSTTEAPAEQAEGNAGELSTLKQLLREQATEDERHAPSNLTLRRILGGDILSTDFIRRQIWLILLITLFIIVYISNGYSVKQNIIEIDKLQQELKDAKFKAFSSRSRLTEKTLQSKVLDMLKNHADSTIRMADEPPYIINVPEK